VTAPAALHRWGVARLARALATGELSASALAGGVDRSGRARRRRSQGAAATTGGGYLIVKLSP